MNRFLLLAPVFLAGCYTYAPIQASTVRPGAEVRARVTATAAEQIAPLLGVSDARVLTGTLVESRAGTMIVEVPTLAPATIGAVSQTFRQRISIAPNELLEIESRQIDRTRTGAILGAVVIVGGSAAIAAFRGGPGLDRPPGGSSTDSHIPLWRLRF